MRKESPADMSVIRAASNRRPTGREMQFSGRKRRAASVLKGLPGLRTLFFQRFSDDAARIPKPSGKPRLKSVEGLIRIIDGQIKKRCWTHPTALFGRALRASCLLVLHLKNLGATELGRMLKNATVPGNLAFTLVVHKSTSTGRISCNTARFSRGVN